MCIESSKLLTNSDVSTITVPTVSVEKRRHRKGRSLAQDHLRPPWENQDPNLGSWEAVHSAIIGGLATVLACLFLNHNTHLRFRLSLGPPGLLLVPSFSSRFFWFPLTLWPFLPRPPCGSFPSGHSLAVMFLDTGPKGGFWRNDEKMPARWQRQDDGVRSEKESWLRAKSLESGPGSNLASTIWPWTSHFTLWGLRFHVCKTEIMNIKHHRLLTLTGSLTTLAMFSQGIWFLQKW